jgi:long-chain fatty acid transport protein
MGTVNIKKIPGQPCAAAECGLSASNRRLKSWSILGLFLGLIPAFCTRASAEGFRNPPPGTFDLGRAGGRIAQVDDASAVQQNPANVVDLATVEAQFTPSIIRYSVDFTSANGQAGTTKEPWKVLPNFFLAAPLDDGRLGLGLGVTVPYGIGNKWDENSPAFSRPTGVLRYQTPHEADLKTINFNPTFSAKIGEHLRVGAGLDVMWSELTLKQFYPWFIFPLSTGTEPDGNAEAKGTGVGYGGNVGVTWVINSRNRLAVTYRSPITVDYSGDFTIDNITPAAASFGATPHSDLNTQIRFPSIVSVGYGLQLTDKIRLETDVEWVEFSRFKSLDLNVHNNSILFPSTSFPQNWRDTFTAGIAGDWEFATNWVFRAGYQYYQTPVPDSTLSPTIPDANQNVFTVGLGYRTRHHSLEFAYGADFYGDRRISNNQNPAFNGTYKFDVHLFSVSYQYSF